MQCVAVSQTSDATGAWNRYSYSFGTGFNDYPKGGVWPDAYYVTYNMISKRPVWRPMLVIKARMAPLRTPTILPVKASVFAGSSFCSIITPLR